MTETLADAISEITADAGRVAMARFGTDFRRWEKTPGHPVCEVDLELDALLRERLGALIPEAGWLSEETLDNPQRLAATKLWVVDPIDGTRDYLRNRPGWAVSVALIDQGRPVVGVLDAPARGEHWRAEAGKGAYRGGERIRVASRDTLAGARVPADALARTDRDMTLVAKPNSIALRIAMVAAGEADLVATLRWGHEWDIAAAVLLAHEAGAAVSDALGQPLAFNTPEGQAFGILATTPGIHAEAVDRLAERAKVAIAR
ncbi:3'(2'),5'-bisphosphate nucleotidase CysQ [Stakelama tenebrarum]|uniref:3'(2'),5'-bisphosphate nucleotidase CysQ n=1 Tax=Stakelama tenebrarum TaxID=2711215 RepID=A0A6G6Y976_9SPHN|nr:3'(2'),5'-bisphosphate nucleotidase CysQ [Sphingosinithalassobacter tenebrarum]QIG81357.1 3'(2'),5'-bisphosphate nucleotidase CysQ [Sphingosinithalassobacter tenebrarum]